MAKHNYPKRRKHPAQHKVNSYARRKPLGGKITVSSYNRGRKRSVKK